MQQTEAHFWVPTGYRTWAALYAAFCVAIAGGACSTTSSIEAPAGACVRGQVTACSCGDGAQSVRTCNADSVYGACDCVGSPTAGSGAGTAGSGGSSGTGVIAGASGGDNGGGASGAAAGMGTGGQAGTDSSGGVSGGGIGGDMQPPEAGSSAGTSAGAGGIGPDAGGQGGEGGQSGEGGQGGESGGDPVPMPAAPGELYGPCLSDSSCGNGLFCVTSTSSSGSNWEQVTSYCTPGCGASTPCPMPATGNVPGSCVFGVCVLQGCQMSTALCPLDMVCRVTDVASPGGTRRVTQCVFE